MLLLMLNKIDTFGWKFFYLYYKLIWILKPLLELTRAGEFNKESSILINGITSNKSDYLSGVMVSNGQCAHHKSEVKSKTLKQVFGVFLICTKHIGVRAKTGWPRVRILCLGIMAQASMLKNLVQRFLSSTKQGSFIINHHLYALILNMNVILSAEL